MNFLKKCLNAIKSVNLREKERTSKSVWLCNRLEDKKRKQYGTDAKIMKDEIGYSIFFCACLPNTTK